MSMHPVLACPVLHAHAHLSAPYQACQTVAKKFPNIEYTEMIVDNTCMQLVSRPEQFDVMVTPNLYG